MRREPANVRFTDLKRICEEYFGKPRQTGTSHATFKTPWSGDPRINIREDKGVLPRRASHKCSRGNSKSFAERPDLANIEIPLPREDLGHHALAANLAQIALLDPVLLHQ